MKRIRKKILDVGIYKITNPIGHIYVGQTFNLTRRKKEHIAYANGREDGPPDLVESLRKYGFDNHAFEVVCRFPKDTDRQILKNFEYFVFTQLKEGGHTMLNLAEGGTGILLSEKSKKLISSRSKEMWNDEFKKRHIQSRIGKPIHSAEEKNKRAGIMKNADRSLWRMHVFTKEDILKGKKVIAERGYSASPDGIQRIREANSRIVLNAQTGIFYYGCKEAAVSANMTEDNLRKKLIGKYKNNTSFIFAQ